MIIYFTVAALRQRNTIGPPTLDETIPYVSNTIQYLTDMGTFIDRVTERLSSTKSNIIKFNIGLTPAYIVTGPKNVQKVLGSPTTLDGNFLQLVLMDRLWDMSKHEISKFANDKSGRSKAPAPGTESTPPYQRYWLGHDQLYVDYLSSRKHSDALADSFYRLFTRHLDEQPVDEWVTVRLFDTLKAVMAESAIVSLFGSQIIDLNPGFVECYWQFDEIAGRLGWGLPKFLQRKSVKTRARLHSMTARHIDSAWEHFDWHGPDADSDWEPHFGSRLSRETAKWLREHGFSNHAAAGHTLATLFGLNGNTVPITAWAMIELIKDPCLFQAVRDEALSSYTTDAKTGARRIDPRVLTNLPLLQSLYVEVMRMHVSFNATRKALEPVVIDGFAVEKGALVQTCSRIAHYDESVWGVEGHPAAEFWAWRHVKAADAVDVGTGEAIRQSQSAMKGRSASFLAYGGGHVMCPGRHFAKQEIMLAIAILVTKFEIEFVSWIRHDGSRSDRPAQDDQMYASFVAMPPDRDAITRWRRKG
ncbi:cytochrome P450 [Hypoxylon sp. FL1284]|nr:cytochrome P450 [Hypoxylon sp. FL1284]